MQRPVCRLCGAKHYSHEAHALTTSPKVVVSSPKAAIPSPKTAYARNRRWREKNRDAYNEYQRVLMKTRYGRRVGR